MLADLENIVPAIFLIIVFLYKPVSNEQKKIIQFSSRSGVMRVNFIYINIKLI